MVLLLDNFDSFTYNLADYIAQCGVAYKVVRNNTHIGDIIREDYDGIILSPGPGTPQQAGNLMQVVAYYVHKVPVLGICLGHQALGMHFGATLSRAIRPMHGKLSSVHLQPDYMFTGLAGCIQVVRYHSLIIADLADPLEITGITDEKEVMAFRHKSLPVRGIQFHPEAALTTNGLHIISNWVKFNKIACCSC